MISSRLEKVIGVMGFLYALFVVGSTFSIALAQLALGGALLIFVIVALSLHYNPFAGDLRGLYCAIAAYLLWTVVSSLAGENSLRALAMLREDWLFAIIPIGIFLLQYPRYRRRVVTSFALAVTIVSLYGLVQHFWGVDWFHSAPLVPAGDFGWRVQGNFGNRLTFGNYYGTAAMFLLGYAAVVREDLAGRRRSFLLAAAALAIIVAVLSYSRGVTVALAVSVVLMGVIMGRRQSLAVLGVVAAGVVVVLLTMPGLVGRFADVATKDIDADYAGGRVFIWTRAAAIIAEHPVFGVGKGNFEDAYAAKLDPDTPDYRKHAHAHNDLLDTAANHGLPGLIFYVAIWVIVLQRMIRGFRERNGFFRGRGRYFAAGLLGSVLFFLTSLTEATFADEEVRQLLMFVWAAGLWPWYKRESNESVADPQTP